MSDETRDLITWSIATILGASAVVGMAVKWVLMPYIREHLINPVKQTARQVNVNGHTSAPPTLLDKVDTLAHKVDALADDIAVASRMFEGHIDLSARDRERIWDTIHQLRVRRHPND